jgi:hypothetical protein
LARDGDDLAAARPQPEIRDMSWHRALLDDDVALAGSGAAPLDLLLSATLPSMSSAIFCRSNSAAGSEAITRPSRSTVMREHRSKTSPMRDEDDAAPQAGQLPDAAEDALDLPLAKGRRGLVEDQDARMAA